ncbi:MAG: transcriptional repressor, partial [Armatimonadota bacterium]
MPQPREITEEAAARRAQDRQEEEVAVERMRRGGLRVTSARLFVLRALRDSEKPLSASQVFSAVKQEGGHIDMVSVYRALSILA